MSSLLLQVTGGASQEWVGGAVGAQALLLLHHYCILLTHHRLSTNNSSLLEPSREVPLSRQLPRGGGARPSINRPQLGTSALAAPLPRLL